MIGGFYCGGGVLAKTKAQKQEAEKWRKQVHSAILLASREKDKKENEVPGEIRKRKFYKQDEPIKTRMRLNASQSCG